MKKPYVVGIAGGSASGKSTLCALLEKNLADCRLAVFHMDKYFKPEEERPLAKAPVTGKIYSDHNCPETADLPRLRRDLAAACGDAETDVIIIEGLLTLWDDEIVSRLDLKLFVDCRPDERIVRRLRRNMGWGLAFDEIAGVYLDLVRYRHDEFVEPSKWRADFILNGSLFSDKAAQILTDSIRAAVEAGGK